MPTTLELARSYVAAGLSVIPVRADGTKAPALASWKDYQSRPPTDAELERWFTPRGSFASGVAVVCGAVSGNLEVLDFDDADTFRAWAAVVDLQCPGLLDRLPQVETPGGGRHVYYRVPGRVPGNQKLARSRDGSVLVETRGEGGYVLAPGCPPACHPSGRTYRHVRGLPLTAVPVWEVRS
jgi:hypothetical protein